MRPVASQTRPWSKAGIDSRMACPVSRSRPLPISTTCPSSVRVRNSWVHRPHVAAGMQRSASPAPVTSATQSPCRSPMEARSSGSSTAGGWKRGARPRGLTPLMPHQASAKCTRLFPRRVAICRRYSVHGPANASERSCWSSREKGSVKSCVMRRLRACRFNAYTCSYAMLPRDAT